MIGIAPERSFKILLRLIEKYEEFGFSEPKLVLADSESVHDAFKQKFPASTIQYQLCMRTVFRDFLKQAKSSIPKKDLSKVTADLSRILLTPLSTPKSFDKSFNDLYLAHHKSDRFAAAARHLFSLKKLYVPAYTRHNANYRLHSPHPYLDLTSDTQKQTPSSKTLPLVLEKQCCSHF
jgi:hypothetical protein